MRGSCRLHLPAGSCNNRNYSVHAIGQTKKFSFYLLEGFFLFTHYWLAYFDIVASLFCMLYCFFACFFCLFFSLPRAINSCRTVIFCQYLILFHSDFLQSCNYFYFFATMFISCQLLIVCIFATMLSTVHKNT